MLPIVLKDSCLLEKELREGNAGKSLVRTQRTNRRGVGTVRTSVTISGDT